MKNIEIEEFAKKLMRLVRDLSIQSVIATETNNSKTKDDRWKKYSKGKIENPKKAVIIDSVDDTIFHLLDAIDNNGIKLIFIADNGKQVDLSREGLGELAGWFAGNEWKKKYSEEGFFDDFKDLRLEL
jgi:hypothetical protein